MTMNSIKLTCIAKRSCNTQAEMIDHRLKITIGVKQNMTVHNAERTYDQIDRLAHGNAMLSHQAEIARSLRRQLRIQHWLDAKLTEVLLNGCGMALVPGTLQHFKKNEIANDNVLRIVDRAQRLNRRMIGVTQMADPDRAIDDNHSN